MQVRLDLSTVALFIAVFGETVKTHATVLISYLVEHKIAL